MNTKSSSANRLRFIDIAKGIAIICIILGHLKNDAINRVVFTFHVPIFFFITGFFTNDNLKIADFIKKKARTLLVPYFITCFVIIFIATVQGAISGDAVSALKSWCYAAIYGSGNSYSKPFYIKSIGAIWFLWAAFWGSIFLRISFVLNKWMRFIFVIALFGAGYFSRSLFWFPLSIQAGACAVLFMYMGYLVRENKDILKEVSMEAKIFGVVFAFVTWIYFIKDFQSFWLVYCNVGRGIVDIFGCVCACSIIMLLSKFIDSKIEFAGKLLAYFGRYSLLVLCVHIVELNLFPWWRVAEKVSEYGMPVMYQLPLIIIGKLFVDLFAVWILSKISLVRNVFGIRN
ncbi:MAG: acyltransferase family protein [Lachnospiraceae bacterium]